MSRRTFILIVLLASGCTDPVPQIGSPFHPDTDLTYAGATNGSRVLLYIKKKIWRGLNPSG